MQLAYLNFGAWPRTDLLPTFAAVLLLALLEATILADVFAPSAAVAGCSVAIVARYLYQSGNSMARGSWRTRIVVAAILLLTILIAGSIGVMAFGR